MENNLKVAPVINTEKPCKDKVWKTETKIYWLYKHPFIKNSLVYIVYCHLHHM